MAWRGAFGPAQLNYDLRPASYHLLRVHVARRGWRAGYATGRCSTSRGRGRLRGRARSGTLGARGVDVVADRPVAFMAGVFPPLVVRVLFNREADRIRTRHDDR